MTATQDSGREREWEFRGLSGHPIAEFVGTVEKAVEAMEETSRVLGVTLALYEVTPDSAAAVSFPAGRNNT